MKIRRNTLRVLILFASPKSLDCIPPETKFLNNDVKCIDVEMYFASDSEAEDNQRVIQ
jgi:hypothetical protein